MNPALKIIAAACIALGTAVARPATAEGSAVDLGNLPLNTWIRVRPEYKAPPDGGRHVPHSWNKLVYDPVGQQAVYMDRWSDSQRGNTIYANAVMTFDAAANKVECLKVGNWKRVAREEGGYRTVPMPENADDPTPCDRHPYGNLAFVPHQNAVYLSAGANRTALVDGTRGHRHCRDTWRFDLETRVWTLIESEQNPPQRLEEAMEYDAASRVIVALVRGGAQTWLLDVDTGQWRNAEARNNPNSGMGAAMTYDSKRERVMVFGGGGKDGGAWNDPHRHVYAYSVEDNAWTRLADASVPVRAMGAAYDSKRDIVLVHAGCGRHPFFFGFYNPETDDWHAIHLPDDAELPAPRWHGLVYDAAHDVYVRATGPWDDPQWWLFRPDIAASVPVETD